MIAHAAGAHVVPTKIRGVLLMNLSSAGHGQDEIMSAALESRGVDVLRVVDIERVDPRKIDLSNVDTLFLSIDCVGHRHTAAAKVAATTRGVALVRLTRAPSTWPSDFRSTETLAAVARQQTVPDDQLDAFLAEFMSRWRDGERAHQLVEPLARFWTCGKLRNAQQLVEYMRALVTTERAPQWFIGWYAENVSAKRPVVSIATPPPPSPPESHARPLTAKLGDFAEIPTPPIVTTNAVESAPEGKITMAASMSMSKKDFILGLDPKLSPMEVIAAAKKKGIKISRTYVQTARKRDKEPRAGSKAALGAVTTFILAQDPNLTAPEVAELGRKAGYKIASGYVGNVRKKHGIEGARVRSSPGMGKRSRLAKPTSNGVANVVHAASTGVVRSTRDVAQSLDVLVDVGIMSRDQAWKALVTFTGGV